MKIDLSFRLYGDTIPKNHGEQVYAAISEKLPFVHDDPEVGIHSIRGQVTGDTLKLTPTSRLVLRVPEERRHEFATLSGQALQIGDGEVAAILQEARPFSPRATLYSHLVIIKGFTEPEPFQEAVQRQLDLLGINAPAYLVKSQNPKYEVIRNVMKIHEKWFVGFAVEVSSLTVTDSLRLQDVGLGGRRRYGCGLFVSA